MVKIFPRIAIDRAIKGSFDLGVPQPYAIISICSESEGDLGPLNGLDSLTDSYMTSVFLDISVEDFGLEGLFRITDDQVREIIKFVDDHKDLHFVVHCDAGISRSGAVGSFISQYLNHDQKEFMDSNPNIMPNPYVLSRLKELSGMNDSYRGFWINHEKEV